MKTIFTFLLALMTTVIFAQDAMFVHTATAGNTSGNVSYITHPDLDNNPGAKIVVSHNWNPGGVGGVYNDKSTGVWYNSGLGQWSVFNEDISAMVMGSSYNVYILQNIHAITHIATLANQGSSDSYSIVNHPLLNGNPAASAVLTNYWNPNAVYNDNNYGFWYDDSNMRWVLYREDLGTLPLDSAYFISVGGTFVQSYRHAANPGNIVSNWTIIDHPLLNGNPNALFVFTHNWGITGDPSNVIIDHRTGAWYDGANWAIYNEDLAAMPDGATFDLLIYDDTLGANDNSIEGLSYYPNPVKDIVNIRANDLITSVSIYNMLGQELAKVEGTTNQVQLDFSTYATGSYFAQVTAGDAVETIKLLKQ